MYLDILRCGVGRWTSVWGDPLVTGLIIMGLFLVAAALCAVAAARTDGRERLFWALAAVAALVFAANVHLDLHILPNAIGHCAARAQGWYDQREIARSTFVVVAAIAMAVLLFAILWVFGRQLITNFVLTSGFALTVSIDAAKGFGRKGWEALFDAPIGFLRLIDLTEMVGAILVILGAALAVRRLRDGLARRSRRTTKLP